MQHVHTAIVLGVGTAPGAASSLRRASAKNCSSMAPQTKPNSKQAEVKLDDRR